MLTKLKLGFDLFPFLVAEYEYWDWNKIYYKLNTTNLNICTSRTDDVNALYLIDVNKAQVVV